MCEALGGQVVEIQSSNKNSYITTHVDKARRKHII